MLHPTDPKAHTHLNNIYSDILHGPERLFTDPIAQDAVLGDVDLLDTVRKIVAEELIAPNATDTPSTSSITPLITNAAIFVQLGGTTVYRSFTVGWRIDTSAGSHQNTNEGIAMLC